MKTCLKNITRNHNFYKLPQLKVLSIYKTNLMYFNESEKPTPKIKEPKSAQTAEKAQKEKKPENKEPKQEAKQPKQESTKASKAQTTQTAQAAPTTPTIPTETPTLTTPDQNPDETYLNSVENYEKEYSTIYNNHVAAQMAYLNTELTTEEVQFCEDMVDELISFGKIKSEKILFLIFYNQHVKKFSGIDPHSLKQSWPEFTKDKIKFWPKENPNWSQFSGSSSSSNSNVSEKKDEQTDKKELKK